MKTRNNVNLFKKDFNKLLKLIKDGNPSELIKEGVINLQTKTDNSY